MEKARQDYSIVIPKLLLESFREEMRIVKDPNAGLWPVDLRMLQQGMLEKLMHDKAFMDKFQVVITLR